MTLRSESGVLGLSRMRLLLVKNKRAHFRDFSHELASEIIKSTVGTTEITPVETEVTRSRKQESHDTVVRRFKEQKGRL